MTDGPMLVIAAFGATIMFGVGVAVFAQGSQQRREIEQIARRRGQRSGVRRLRVRLDSLLRRTQWGRSLIEWLRPAGLEANVLEVGALGLGALLLFLFYLPPRTTPLVSIVLLAGAVFAGRAFIRVRRQQRITAFIAQLPDLARLLSNAVAAGQALPSALRRAALELDEPARSTLTLVTDELRLGQPLDRALERLGAAIDSRELVVLVSTLIIQQRAGGDAVKALRGMSSTLEERKDLRREITTILSGVKAITVAVAVMPLGALVLLNSIDDRVIPQLTDTLLGNMVLFIGLGLIGTGIVLIRRVSKVDL